MVRLLITWAGPATGLFVIYVKQPPIPGYPIILLWLYQLILLMEFIENNMRFLKLKGPIRDGIYLEGKYLY